jgi:ppGpp synthetase/RelA/SpoT-type nucleotidyltranferase
MPERTNEDLLREQYFKLLPDIHKVVSYLDAEIRYRTREILQRMKPHEQLVIESRVKECESAVESLRRRQKDGGTFDPENLGRYSLLDLPDLAGVRVLVFPRTRLNEVNDVLATLFTGWMPDPVPDDEGGVLAHKYIGKCQNVSREINVEYQVVPMLIGLFWKVEHSAMYKFRKVANSKEMQNYRANVHNALLHFEAEFENFVENIDQSFS